MSTPRSHSIQARLLNYSRERQVNHSHTLVRYGVERLMYRLSRSPHADRFVLKGAVLFFRHPGWLGRVCDCLHDLSWKV